MPSRVLSACLATSLAAMMVLSVACTAGKFGTPSSPSDSPSTLTSPLPTLPSGISPAYTQDVKPILDANCVRCHGGSRPSAGVNLTTYAGVMRVVVAGSASSRLVVVSSSTGSMYGYLSGDRASRAAMIRSWVLLGAAQNR
jgi:hypothetical protein